MSSLLSALRSASRGLAGHLRRPVVGVAAAMLALVAPGLAAAQAPGASAVAATPAWLRARLDGRLDGRTRAAVERVLDSAYIAGIPAEPLVDKALEGASKRASGEAIVRAVRTLAVDLTAARQVLGAGSLPSELAAGAAAVRAGIDGAALRSLRRDRPGQPLTVPLSVLTDLVASGVPAEGAARTVLTLTKAGLVDEQLVAFRRDVERDIGIGAPPAAAVALSVGRLGYNAALLDAPGSPGAQGGMGGKRRP